MFFGRHATRDVSRPIFLASQAAPVLGQTLIDHLASQNRDAYFAATCLGLVLSVPPIPFFLNRYVILYKIVQVREKTDLEWTQIPRSGFCRFLLFHSFVSVPITNVIIEYKVHVQISGLLNRDIRQLNFLRAASITAPLRALTYFASVVCHPFCTVVSHVQEAYCLHGVCEEKQQYGSRVPPAT